MSSSILMQLASLTTVWCEKVPAGRDEAEHDVVAGLQPRDALADLLDDAGALVAADDGQRERQVAGHQVLVGVAHTRRRHLDEDLALLGRVELDLLDAPILADHPEDGGLRLHTNPPDVDCCRGRYTGT
jgi:hypothetical protein